MLLRLRPASQSTSKCVEVISNDSVRFRGDTNATFTLDRVFGEACTQAALFEACRPVVDALLDSYNGTIMAYGQTGSGKTHSLFGTPQQPGLVPQVVRTLVQQLAPNTTLHMSVIEIYCERIRDLLQGRDNLAIGTDRERGVYVVDAAEVEVRDADQALKTVQAALGRRAVAATNMNERSSRSHCMVTLTLTKQGNKTSKLCLVDLAGSERQDKTGADGSVLDEAKLINKSLSCLGNVVNALTQQKRTSHIPYRDSKLTRVLQDSLGGSAQTIILLCASPSSDAAAETLSCLRFGVRARGLHNMVVQRGGTDADAADTTTTARRQPAARSYYACAMACAVQAAAFAAYFYWLDV